MMQYQLGKQINNDDAILDPVMMTHYDDAILDPVMMTHWYDAILDLVMMNTQINTDES